MHAQRWLPLSVLFLLPVLVLLWRMLSMCECRCWLGRPFDAAAVPGGVFAVFFSAWFGMQPWVRVKHLLLLRVALSQM